MKRSRSGSRIDACAACSKFSLVFDSRNLESIRASANAGCRFCQLIRDVIDSYNPGLSGAQEITAMGSGQPTQLTWNTEEGQTLKVTMYGVPKDSLRVGEKAEYEYHSPLVTDVPEILCDTGCPKAIAVTRAFMRECQNSESCSPSKSSNLPTRVLDLGPPGSSGSIRLYKTRNRKGRYVCLSHCWGTGHGLLKTTQDTLLVRKRGILESELPKTFLDAVIFTRMLRIRYLWIDSLCIIQDDNHDWQREASNMQSIYRHSYLTLAASKSGGPNEGLFSVSPEEFKLRKIPFKTNRGTRNIVSVRHSITHLGSRDHFPLLKRGWVFQERVLSGRVLHFGPQELAWECMCYTSCECAHGGTWDEDNDFSKFWFPGLLTEPNIVPWQHMWYNIVENYSALDLTFEKDIFPALSGIAQRMMKVRDTRYLAGLWDDTLIEDLLWHRRSRVNRWESAVRIQQCARPGVWRAPTWSWASVKGAVEFSYDERAERYHRFTPHIVGFDVQIGHTSEDTTGQLEKAKLIVFGFLAPARIRHDHGETMDDTGAPISIEVNGKLVNGAIVCFVDYDVWSASGHQVGDNETIHCLMVGTWQDPEKSYGEVFYLILRSYRISDEEYFERIGLLVLSSGQGGFSEVVAREVTII